MSFNLSLEYLHEQCFWRNLWVTIKSIVLMFFLDVCLWMMFMPKNNSCVQIENIIPNLVCRAR